MPKAQSKRYSQEQWKELKANFIVWCVKNSSTDIKAFYTATNEQKRYPFQYQSLWKQSNVNGWVDEAQGEINRLDAPKLREELKQSKEDNKETVKQLTTIVLTKEECQDADKAINLISDVFAKVQKGFGHNVNSHTTLAQIVDNQLKGMLKLQGEGGTRSLDREEVEACVGLVGCLDKLFTINQKSALFTKDQLKDLKSLHDHRQEEIILYKEQAKLTGKKDENSERQEEMHEFYKEQSRNEGIPIN